MQNVIVVDNYEYFSSCRSFIHVFTRVKTHILWILNSGIQCNKIDMTNHTHTKKNEIKTEMKE